MKRKTIYFFTISLFFLLLIFPIKITTLEVNNYIKNVNSNYNVVIDILIPLLTTMFGSFLGFFLGILGQILYDKNKNRKETNNIIVLLKNEITINIAKKYNDNELYREFYQLYSFNGIQTTGKLYFINDEAWYQEMINIYNRYKEINYFCELIIKQSQNNIDYLKLNQEISLEIIEIKKDAEKIINNMKTH